MPNTRKKKYTSGEGSEYWTRNTALKKLQLSLKDFRRLCILKGIYPREPRNRKKAQHGDTSIKTLYAKKDIQFLMHEPIIWKLRELKTHTRKITRAKTQREFKEFARLKRTYPEISLDHIVKERYPTFLSALRDLDDCLTMCFLFSTFPQVKPLPRDLPAVCRRLSFEFLHAVIVSQALRKVFISIKGYYFQTEIKGQTITWIMPHNFGFEPQPKQEVDFNIMTTFVQFYTVLLGFVNFRLYHCLNLYYPPKISTSDKRDNEIVDKQSYNNERVAALNIPLQRSAGIPQNEDDDIQIDVFENAGDNDAIQKAKLEAESVNKLKTLFKGLKVFINREVPRLPLVFTLKCFGAEVSWDKTLFVGAVFDESDETITHQIVDRPSVDKQYISRYYIQPQWVFDSVNARRLLPVEKYFIGVELPPHLSPFVDADDYGIENYVPPEQLQLNKEANGEDTALAEEIGLITPKRRKKKKVKKDSLADTDSDEDSKEKEVIDSSTLSDKVKSTSKITNAETAAEKKREKMKKKMAVKTGKVIAADPMEQKKAEYQEFKLREKMVPKKYKKLYASMMRGKHNRKVDKIMLNKKRVKLERIKKRQTSNNAV